MRALIPKGMRELSEKLDRGEKTAVTEIGFRLNWLNINIGRYVEQSVNVI